MHCESVLLRHICTGTSFGGTHNIPFRLTSTKKRKLSEAICVSASVSYASLHRRLLGNVDCDSACAVGTDLAENMGTILR